MFLLHPHTLFFAIFLCSICPSLSYGQTISKADSLRHREAINMERELKYQSAYEIYEENIKLFETKSSNNPHYRELTARSLLNGANCLRQLELMNRAAEKFDDAIEAYSEVLVNDMKYFSHNNLTKIYRRVGNVYYNYSRVALSQGDIKKAKDLNEEAGKWYEKTGNCRLQILQTNQKAYILYDEFNYDEGILDAEKALEKFEDCGNLHSNLKASTLHTTAYGYEGLENYDIAIDKYSESLKYMVMNRKIDSLNHAKTLLNIGLIYIDINEASQAKKYLNKSLKMIEEASHFAEYSFSYSSVYENLGDVGMLENDYRTAISLYDKAIDNLKDNPRSETPYIYNKVDLIRVLDLKAQAYKEIGNTSEAYRIYEALDDWISEFYKDLNTKESKLTWIDRAHTIYGNAVEVALMENDQSRAFKYAERAHAVLLWQSLSQQAAQSLLSDEDKNEMEKLTAKIRQASQLYNNGKIPTSTLRSLVRERDALEETFDDKYEAYAKRKTPQDITLDDIQSKITNNHTAFIEYYLTDETSYIFTITKNGLEVTQKKAEGLADDISNFVKNISREDTNTEDYHALAHKLYKQLIPQSIQSNDKINRLVITPDSEIGKLPFSALATQLSSGKFSEKTPFLLKKYTTNYLYSAGSYLQLQQKKTDQEYCFAGIAPKEYEMEKWKDEPLNQAVEELESVQSLHWRWQREILKEKEATKTAFKRIIKEGYRTILVSTHAVYGKNGGEIIFRDSILTQDEIDLLEINTHRLIFSACETGVGKQNQGEGVLSLGWNFAYKGVPSITMTHWGVNQFAAKEIIVSYSENLNDEMFADQALRAAQLKYLKKHDGGNRTGPYYWAAFFHTGSTK